MLDMNVFGFSQRTVSATYRETVGNEQPRDSVMIWPDADWEKASI